MKKILMLLLGVCSMVGITAQADEIKYSSAPASQQAMELLNSKNVVWSVMPYDNSPHPGYTQDFCNTIMHNFEHALNINNEVTNLTPKQPRVSLKFLDTITQYLDSKHLLLLGKASESFNYEGKVYNSIVSIAYLFDIDKRIIRGVYNGNYCKGHFIIVPYIKGTSAPQ